MLIIKRDGRREEFNRDKLWSSLTKACAKRPLPIGSIDKAIEDIETQVANMGRAETSSRIIGEMVMDRLKGLDRVAYIRFVSVYRDFEDIQSFKEEIEALLDPQAAEVSDGSQLSFLADENPPDQRPRRGRRTKRSLSDLA